MEGKRGSVGMSAAGRSSGIQESEKREKEVEECLEWEEAEEGLEREEVKECLEREGV